MSGLAISIEGLSKQYRLGLITSQTLREDISRWYARIRGAADPLRKVNDVSPDRSGQFVWALRDVNIDVSQGEVVGIIGANGAGKSTLLKVLSRITAPTTGRARIRGRVGSLLEVGTGFHAELTGRENVYLNGAILGMRRAEIDRKFDEIVAFSEIERFIDTPVKRYSSGMFIRLAFAVAAHLETDVLIVDEVLAVGDASFQSKCLDKMSEVSAAGRTVLFVSHNLSSVQGLCSRAIWIDHGRVAATGPTPQVVATYLEQVSMASMARRSRPSRETDAVEIVRVLVRGASDEPRLTLRPWEPLDLEVFYVCRERTPSPHFWISVDSQFGSLFGASMLFDGQCPDWIEGHGALRCRFTNLPLLPQNYSVTVGVRDATGTQNLCRPETVAMFSIVGTGRDYDFEGDVVDSLMGMSTPMMLPYEWRFNDGTVKVPAWTRRKGHG